MKGDSKGHELIKLRLHEDKRIKGHIEYYMRTRGKGTYRELHEDKRIKGHMYRDK